MQTHRGTTQATLNGYRLTLIALLDRLGDIAWHDATFCVVGKTQRTTRLPLQHEGGDALLVYGERARPHVSTPHVFLTITAPVRPLSAKAVSQIAARALHRAHVASPS